MRHFDATRWVDFVRGIGEAEELAAMQRHLDGGCSRCAATVGALRNVAATADADAALEVSAGTLRSVKAIFAPGDPPTPRSAGTGSARAV